LGAGDRDDVKRVVELAVPAAVEPVLGALPRAAGNRRGRGLQPEARVLAEPLHASGVTDQDRRGQRPAPLLVQQPRATRVDELRQLCLKPIALAVEVAQTRDLVTGDPPTRTGGQLAQPPGDPVKHARLVQRAALDRALELGGELEKMPAQAADRPSPLGDEILPVIGDQADLHRLWDGLRIAGTGCAA
jgi:hypothetical protein